MSEELSKVKKICTEMCLQRNYTNINDNGNYMSSKDEENVVLIFFIIDNKLNIDESHNIITTMINNKSKHAIIVHFKGLTPVSNKVLSDMYDYEFELFEHKELMYNITKHVLVPSHRVLTFENNEEEKIFKEKFKKICTIQKSDPVSKFYNFKKGDIIEVKRQNGYVAYRIVK